jgi:glycosyltransferase involved in cell wall biosynthesis
MQSIVVVVPCFNEAERLDLREFRASLAREPALRYIFVDDGSADRTAEILAGFAAEQPGRAELLKLERNGGKAEAVRRGVLYAADRRADLIGYWDADLATPLGAIPSFVAVFADPTVAFVMGSRVQLLGKQVHRRPSRHYIGRIFATAVSRLLDLRVYDTQCGAKLLRATPEMLEAFARPFQLRWCFDVELLARLLGQQERGVFDVYRQCAELPLQAWRDVGGSKLGPGQFPKIALELLRLRRIVAEERAAGRAA